MDLLFYDDANMRTTAAERKAFEPALKKAHKRLDDLRASNAQGFFDLPFDTKGLKTARASAKRLQAKFDRLIVIGIGGSDLGARMLHAALGGNKMRLTFVSNPDPETVSALLDEVNWKKTAICVVSKSGTTLETMSVFFVLRDALIAAVGAKSHAAHVVAITEASDASVLYQVATGAGYEVLEHPTNVGGRFSVLSVVGLFPAACAGADVAKLLRGAKTYELDRRSAGIKSSAARFTTHQLNSYLNHGRGIHVVMPYADALHPFGLWYRQLWAESLGKVRGDQHVGPTPIAAFGAIDQHSQIQLYVEGPDDKTVTFIQLDRFKRDIRVSGKLGGIPVALRFAQGKTFGEILAAERVGTSRALSASGHPNGTIHLPTINAESLGALIQMFLTATAYAGELLEINTYDQPGVEHGKREAKQILSK
ncbi:glucose-6-phosphate isomerase [bacterium]|nr:glucose-6-phosphate isomerase [bacterium]